MNIHTTLLEAKTRLESNIERLLVGFKMGTGLTVVECNLQVAPVYLVSTSNPTFQITGVSVTLEPL